MTYKVTMEITDLDFEPTDNDLREIQYRAADWLCVSPMRAKMILEHSRTGVKKILDNTDTRPLELKSCPFCAGPPKLESDPHRKEWGRDRFRIVCASCYAGTRWCDSSGEAWAIWNGRVKE